MPIFAGNQWNCDNPMCRNSEFVKRESPQPIPKDWISTEMNQGTIHIVVCSPKCLTEALAAITTKNSP